MSDQNMELPAPVTNIPQSEVSIDLAIKDSESPSVAVEETATVMTEDIFAKEEPEAEPAKEEPVVPKSENIFTSMPALTFDTPAHNVTRGTPTTVPGKGLFPETLDLPSSSASTQERLIASFPNLNAITDKNDLEWSQTFMGSVTMSPLDEAVDKSLNRPDSDWHQGLMINGELFRSAIPPIAKPTNSEISGEQGLQMAFSHMGMGDFFHAAMYNSGFWLTFTPAPESVWLNINRILGADVTGISRQTYGMLHSSATSLAVSTIINSILPYVYGTSVKNTEMPVRDIPKYLSTNDEHDFIWGFICANYPHGVSIERSCIADPNACRAVIQEKLQITELQVVDRSFLPEANQIHMRNRRHGVMSLQSVLDYQERLINKSDRSITLTGLNGTEAKFILSVPSAEKKARMSNAYVEEVQAAILAAVTQEEPGAAREALYDQHTTATELRLYQHWVKSIELSGVGNVINDEKTIASTLGAWTRDARLRDKFFEEMSNFINSSNATAIGMEPAKCPKCGSDHNRPEQKLRGKIDYIPLDVIQVFSTLADFKTRLISARA